MNIISKKKKLSFKKISQAHNFNTELNDPQIFNSIMFAENLIENLNHVSWTKFCIYKDFFPIELTSAVYTNEAQNLTEKDSENEFNTTSLFETCIVS